MATKTQDAKSNPRGGGQNRKTIDEHVAAGTYRRDRHGPLRPDTLQFPPKPAALVKASAHSQSRWVRNASDENAVRNGCRFNEALAAHIVDFFAQLLRHSKGRWAGDAFDLLDWQRDELIYPLFGWVRPDGSRRFRRAYVEVPKKNGKSTLASGVGLYMLTADAEPGAEVYSVASDRDQASIVHGEAVNMAESSEELAGCLKVNRSTKNILYQPTRSWYRAISSKPGGKEGINIHCAIIDELHVWRGRELWDALKYGYRSRRQPLQFVITTAGDDLESICRKQHERGRHVIDGTIRDDSFFALIYAAERDDDWQAESTWHKANPSLGETIHVDDFRQDADEARDTAGNESAFKRYSLNVWATATNPWLRIEHWKACAEDYIEQDLAGQDCWMGLDLSKTQDMTAAVLLFPQDDGQFRLLPYFWLPEAAARNYQHLVDYSQWARDGHLELTPGEVCDYSFVKDRIAHLSEQYNIRELAFDPYNAEQLTQSLEDETGVPRIAFGQTIYNFAEPTAEFERLVIGGKMHHNDHPIMSWQIGHTKVKIDVNANKRPVKPEPKDYRKIDGVVAAIMALGRASMQDAGSVYDDRGLVTL